MSAETQEEHTKYGKAIMLIQVYDLSELIPTIQSIRLFNLPIVH